MVNHASPNVPRASGPRVFPKASRQRFGKHAPHVKRLSQRSATSAVKLGVQGPRALTSSALKILDQNLVNVSTKMVKLTTPRLLLQTPVNFAKQPAYRIFNVKHMSMTNHKNNAKYSSARASGMVEPRQTRLAI